VDLSPAERQMLRVARRLPLPGLRLLDFEQ
jgi:hypothetical protein